jgi:RNA polymerase sigma-70 factor (ECF subfamily)
MTGWQHTQGLAAARGDDEALAVLVRAYQQRVYQFGRRVCRDDLDAEDAVQEAFVKLLRRPDVVKDAGALSWLMSVVRNACLRMLRPFRRERRALGERVREPEEIASDAVDPQAALERWELVQRVHAAVAELERPYREVLVLRDLEGLTGDEACTALGLESATMKTRLHRARGQLRRALQQERSLATLGLGP